MVVWGDQHWTGADVSVECPTGTAMSKGTNEDYVPQRRLFGGSGNKSESPVLAATTRRQRQGHSRQDRAYHQAAQRGQA